MLALRSCWLGSVEACIHFREETNIVQDPSSGDKLYSDTLEAREIRIANTAKALDFTVPTAINKQASTPGILQGRKEKRRNKKNRKRT